MTKRYRDMDVEEIKLDAKCELRFSVESKSEKVCLMLKVGSAEIFGSELDVGKRYEFSAGANIGVFSWKGCLLEVQGKPDGCYIAKETLMDQYIQLHYSLELMRINAVKDKRRGPVTMVVGPKDAGKSTLCRLLLNYAVRSRRKPLFVDLDVGRGQISVPGSMGTLLVGRPASVENGFTQGSSRSSLVYHFGLKSPDENRTLYGLLQRHLANTIKRAKKVGKRTIFDGVVINTRAWESGRHEELLDAAKAFEVDYILVLDQERLHHELLRDVPKSTKVVFLRKSGGAEDRLETERVEERYQKLREYFSGTPKNGLSPHSFDIKWSEMKIFRIGLPHPLPECCLPYGMKPEALRTMLMPIMPNAGLLHHLLAVSRVKSNEENILLTRVAGYVCVTSVDSDKQTVTLRSSHMNDISGKSNIFLFSDIKFFNSN